VNSYREPRLEEMRQRVKARGYVGVECVLFDMIDRMMAMATHTRSKCPACGSYAMVEEGRKLTRKCAKCGHMGETRKFAKDSPSRNVGIREDRTSVPRVNKRRQKGQRRIWKPGRDE